MEVAPATYLKLFDLLIERISTEGYPNDSKKPTLKQICNAKKIIDKKPENISEHYLFASFSYFVNLRTKAWKGHDVNVHDIRLVKAIEFVNRVPQKEGYSGQEWAKVAIPLVRHFENNHNLQKPKDHIETENPETLFLNIVATEKNIFESSQIKSITTKYFTAICEGRLLEAWELLSPNLRKNSIWDGEFLNFEITSSFFKSIEPPEYSDFIYEFKKISFQMFIEVIGSVYDVNEIFHVIENLSWHGPCRFNNLRRTILRGLRFNQERQEMEQCQVNLSLCPYKLSTEIYRTHKRHWKSLTLQQHYLTLNIDSQKNLTTEERRVVFKFIDRRKLTRYDRGFGLRINVTCRYFHNRWMIDEIRFIDEFPRSGRLYI